MTNFTKHLLAASGVSLLLAGATVAHADEHGELRELVQQGRILPLQTVIERASKEHPGQLLEAELDKENDQWIYELELLASDGRAQELYYDAGTGETLPDFKDD
jgi:uncharacterized membrane protein YkoI